MQAAEFISTRSKLDGQIRQAETDIARARAALGMGQLQVAANVLDRLADGFGAISPSLPAYVRTELWKVFRNHGLREGPQALELAEEMLDRGIKGLPSNAPEAIRSNAVGSLSILRAIRSGAAPGEDVLRSIARSYSPQNEPLLWANANFNLADLLAADDRPDEATRFYALALRVFTRQTHPLEWARIQVRLGKIIQAEGQMADALAVYRNVVDTIAEHADRVEWAALQIDIGTALLEQSQSMDGHEDTWMLVQACEALRNAQDVHRDDAIPATWALIREKLALAELALADHCATPVAYPHLRAALRHLDVVLAVCRAGFVQERQPEVEALREEIVTRLGGPGVGLGATTMQIPNVASVAE